MPGTFIFICKFKRLKEQIIEGNILEFAKLLDIKEEQAVNINLEINYNQIFEQGFLKGQEIALVLSLMKPERQVFRSINRNALKLGHFMFFRRFGYFPLLEVLMPTTHIIIGENAPHLMHVELLVGVMLFNFHSFDFQSNHFFNQFETLKNYHLENLRKFEYVFSYEKLSDLESVENSENPPQNLDFICCYLAVLVTEDFEFIQKNPQNKKKLAEIFAELSRKSVLYLCYDSFCLYLMAYLIFQFPLTKKKPFFIPVLNKLNLFFNQDSAKLMQNINDVLSENITRQIRKHSAQFPVIEIKTEFRIIDREYTKNGQEPANYDHFDKTQINRNPEKSDWLAYKNGDVNMFDFVTEFVDSRHFAMIFHPSKLKQELEIYLTQFNFEFSKDHFDFPFHFDFLVKTANGEFYLDVEDEYKFYFNQPNIAYFEEKMKVLYCKNAEINHFTIDNASLLNGFEAFMEKCKGSIEKKS